MGKNYASDDDTDPQFSTMDTNGTVQFSRGLRDPFRAVGVPDRLVISLHREGLLYVGRLITWEYREIEVSRRNGPGDRVHVDREMVVDAAYPREVDVVVRMYERPTAARVVAELVTVLRSLVSTLAGRDRRMPPHSAEQGRHASSHSVTQLRPE